MKIQYLGTAAYDAIPSPFCHCDTCLRAKKLGGRNIRTRTQSIINDDLLIDFNPDTVCHFLHYNIDWDKIDNCLITHSHEDHLYVEDDMLIPRFGYQPHRVRYYSGKSGYDIIMAGMHKFPIMLEKDLARVSLVEPYKEFTAGGYRILPVRAQHDPLSSPVLYAIERDGKRLLYGNDSGYFYEDAIEALKGFGRFDLVSFDCTGALNPDNWRKDHMGFVTVRELADRLMREGIMDEKTIKVLNHFSHNGLANYDELAGPAEEMGYVVSYDGMTVEF